MAVNGALLNVLLIAAQKITCLEKIRNLLYDPNKECQHFF